MLRMACCACLTIGMAACATPMPEKMVNDRTHVLQKDGTINLSLASAADERIEIQYLGAAGFAFTVGESRVLAAPFYTNTRILGLLPFVPMKANEACIDNKFPPELRDANSTIETAAILVGHSHYDHLLDVPYLMGTHLKNAKAIGSRTAQLMINKQLRLEENSKKRALDAGAHSVINVSEKIRVYPIEASHAPHFGHFTAMTGHYNSAPKLWNAWDWKMGKVYAFLLDFLNEVGDPIFRIFFQDSASELNTVEIPWDLAGDKPIDVAILTLAGFANVEDYPGSVIRETEAKLNIVGHWDDFFGGCNGPVLVARLTDALDFRHALLKATTDSDGNTIPWRLLYPNVTLSVTGDSLNSR